MIKWGTQQCQYHQRLVGLSFTDYMKFYFLFICFESSYHKYCVSANEWVGIICLNASRSEFNGPCLCCMSESFTLPSQSSNTLTPWSYEQQRCGGEGSRRVKEGEGRWGEDTSPLAAKWMRYLFQLFVFDQFHLRSVTFSSLQSITTHSCSYCSLCCVGSLPNMLPVVFL